MNFWRIKKFSFHGRLLLQTGTVGDWTTGDVPIQAMQRGRAALTSVHLTRHRMGGQRHRHPLFALKVVEINS